MGNSQEQAFLESYDAYAEAIYRHCFFRVYTAPKAEELVQETFLKTWNYIQKGNKIDNLRAFLYRTANNLIIDYSRKKKDESLENLMDGNAVNEPSYDDRERVDNKILFEQIQPILDDLPEDMRHLIIMRYIDDLDPKDIADVLQISANNVSVRLNRALEILRANLNSEQDHENFL